MPKSTALKTKGVNPNPKTEPGIDLTRVVRFYAPTVMKALRDKGATKENNCCCCCCCKQDGPLAGDSVCSVDEFDVVQELQLDPNSFGVLPSPLIVGTRADVRWSVTAPAGSTVTVQIRTRGVDGNPGPPFADWTDLFTNQGLIDQVRYQANRVLGTKVEFRVIVLDGDGRTICAGPPDC